MARRKVERALANYVEGVSPLRGVTVVAGPDGAYVSIPFLLECLKDVIDSIDSDKVHQSIGGREGERSLTIALINQLKHLATEQETTIAEGAVVLRNEDYARLISAANSWLRQVADELTPSEMEVVSSPDRDIYYSGVPNAQTNPNPKPRKPRTPKPKVQPEAEREPLVTTALPEQSRKRRILY